MPATVFLHIGANKTASSAIQCFFNENRGKLAEDGILYPVSGRIKNAHYGVSRLLGFVQGKPAPVDLMSRPLVELSEALSDEVTSSGAKHVVISSEYFVVPKSVEAVRSFFANYDVKVVVYVRRHDKWWPSAYNQAVRTVVNPPWGRGFKSYLNFYRNLGPCPSRAAYRLLLDRWAKVFGKKNIIVRPYEEQQNKPSIIHDFMRAIGCSDVATGLATISKRVNDSVDMKTLALVEAFQRAKIDPDIRARLITYAFENKKASAGVVLADPALLLGVVRQNEGDYEYIAREYLGRTDGRLFYEPIPDPDMPWQKVKPPRPEEIVESVVAVMGERWSARRMVKAALEEMRVES